MSGTQLISGRASYDSTSLCFVIRRACRRIFFHVPSDVVELGLFAKGIKPDIVPFGQFKSRGYVGIRELNMAYQVLVDLEMAMPRFEYNIVALGACRSYPCQCVLELIAGLFNSLLIACELFRVCLVGGIDPVCVSVWLWNVVVYID